MKCMYKYKHIHNNSTVSSLNLAMVNIVVYLIAHDT